MPVQEEKEKSMEILDSIKLLYCLNEKGVDKAHKVLIDLVNNYEYQEITPGELIKEIAESNKTVTLKQKEEQRIQQQKKTQEDQEIRKEFAKELFMIEQNPAPWTDDKFLRAIDKLNIIPVFKVWNIYTWGYIHGKRVERTKRKKVSV